MAVSTKISKSGVWLLLGGFGIAAAQSAGCSPPFHSCYETRTCPVPPAEAGAAGDESGGTSGGVGRPIVGAAGSSRAGTGGIPLASAGGGAHDAGSAGEAGEAGAWGATAGGASGATAGGASAAGTAGSSPGGASGCAASCASYQFCASSKCLPAYVSTRVLPATDQVSGSGQVNGAVVLTNKPQGDIVVQLSGELNIYDPGASMQTALTGSGYARYTTDGKLAWFRSRESLVSSTSVSRESAIALVPPSDFALSYAKYDPPTGPTAGTYSFRLARINGNSGNLTWEAKYPTTTDGSGSNLLVVPRMAQGDLLTFDPAVAYFPGETCQVTDQGAAPSVACLGSNYVIGALAGTDGTTWTWGAPIDTVSSALNPFSAEKSSFTANPYQFGGSDAFILGIRGVSTSVGPWMSEGDYGPTLGLAALPGGDLAVTAQGNGYMTFNGGQSLLGETGSILFRLDTTTGQIVWRKALAQTPSKIITAPGGRIAVLNHASATAPSLQLFDGANGALLSTLPLPPTSYPVLAAGQTDLFVLGDYSSAVDFDPGPGTDKPTSSRGVYISRYSFE